MATYNDTYNACFGNATLLNQVVVACVNQCRTIFTEAAGTTDHANRLTWAIRTVKDPVTAAKNMLLAIATDATIQGTLPTPGPTDAQVLTAVGSVLNVFADNGL